MEIDEQEFNKKIADGGKFIVDFFAVWCGPCKMFAPIFEKAIASAKKQNSAVEFVKIDVDKCPDTAQKYGIRSVPTIILFDGGAVSATHIGTFGTPNELLAFANQ